ncbi:MAG: hypothetical protein EAY75_03485 [Bacteroidetes bacterium]|nr:MAG: hypothetical protein EAY75_03485 [Bacteroidota bacterium]
MKLKQILTAVMFAAILFPTMASAAFTRATTLVKVETKKSYRLDLGNISSMSDAQIEKSVQNFLNAIENDEELTCSVTVTGSLDAGPFSFEISVTVSGPCGEVRAEGKKIATQVLNEVKDYLKKQF